MNNLSKEDKEYLIKVLDQIDKKYIERSYEQEVEVDEFKLHSPKDIYDYLDRFIVGQDDAKKTIAIGAHNHYIA